MSNETYPSTWPKPNPRKPTALQSRITEQQKTALYNREITTRELAKELSIHEKYLSYAFPGKVEIVDKKPLIEARKAYKLEVAREVLQGKYSIQQAADVAHVSYNTMQRFVTKAKELFVEEAKNYEKVLLEQRKCTLKHARSLRNVR